jgi:hypothetical protein
MVDIASTFRTLDPVESSLADREQLFDCAGSVRSSGHCALGASS